MSKGTRGSVLGKSLLGFALILLFLGPVLALTACDACVDLTADTSLGAGVTVEATTGTTTTTVPVGVAETDAAAEPAPSGGSDTPPEETTTTRPFYRPTTVSLSALPFTPTWTRFEETDPRISYQDGLWGWTDYTDSAASGGTYKAVVNFDSPAAGLTIRFEGSCVALVAIKSRDCCKASLSLDGGAPFLVDLYGTATSSVVVWTSPDLAYGVHVLRVEQTNSVNPAATGLRLTIDAVSVLGTLVY